MLIWRIRLRKAVRTLNFEIIDRPRYVIHAMSVEHICNSILSAYGSIQYMVVSTLQILILIIPKEAQKRFAPQSTANGDTLTSISISFGGAK